MKIGDKVSVTDDNLEGVITSVNGNTVVFKDEFGFTYQYPKEKLVARTPDLYKNINVEKKFEYSPPKSKKHNNSPYILDLHFHKIAGAEKITNSFERLFLQREKLLETLDFCRTHRLKRLEIIHGIGDGTLQKMVWDVLESQTNLDFYNKDILHHQSGAVMVDFH